MSDYTVGDTALLEVGPIMDVRVDPPVAYDPLTILLRIKDPSGAVREITASDPDWQHIETGRFGYPLALNTAGRWLGEWVWDTGDEPFELLVARSLLVADESIVGVEDYTPTLDNVASLMRARTVERGTGRELGTFTAETRPTAELVGTIINEAVELIAPQIGFSVKAKFARSARSVCTLQAAILVEASMRNQVGSDQGSADWWQKTLDATLKALIDAIARDQIDGEGAPGVAIPAPEYSFPLGLELDPELGPECW